MNFEEHCCLFLKETAASFSSFHSNLDDFWTMRVLGPTADRIGRPWVGFETTISWTPMTGPNLWTVCQTTDYRWLPLVLATGPGKAMIYQISNLSRSMDVRAVRVEKYLAKTIDKAIEDALAPLRVRLT
uniref:Uncharacterized protein n=1 Tax=Solanum tuberosum TaxID=4113 RepID=M1E114_SOLTU